MNETIPLTQSQLPDFLLHVATVRPAMILGAPGIGKTALVVQFGEMVGLPCVSLLGSQLAPGDRVERAADFPKDGPILVITDGACDVLRIRRDHAFLIPVGGRLPFTPRGPVFRVR